MKKFFIGCLIVVFGLIAVLALIIKLTPQEEKDKYAAKRQAEIHAADSLVKVLVQRFQQTRSKLPTLSETSFPKYCTPISKENLTMFPISVTEMAQYQGDQFIRDTTSKHEPWRTKFMQIINENYSESRDPYTWDYDEVSDVARQILAHNYFTVYVPLTYQPPKVLDDDKFQSGYYDGWVILCDMQTGEPVGYTLFEVISSEKIENERFGVGVGPISIPLTGSPIEKKLKEDFRNRFYNASYNAVLSMMRN